MKFSIGVLSCPMKTSAANHLCPLKASDIEKPLYEYPDSGIFIQGTNSLRGTTLFPAVYAADSRPA